MYTKKKPSSDAVCPFNVKMWKFDKTAATTASTLATVAGTRLAAASCLSSSTAANSSYFLVLSQPKGSWLVMEYIAITGPIENTFYWEFARWMNQISVLKS